MTLPQNKKLYLYLKNGQTVTNLLEIPKSEGLLFVSSMAFFPWRSVTSPLIAAKLQNLESALQSGTPQVTNVQKPSKSGQKNFHSQGKRSNFNTKFEEFMIKALADVEKPRPKLSR